MCSSDLTKIGILGAAGRMGRMLIRDVLATSGAELAGGVDTSAIGEDLGVLAGAKPAGLLERPHRRFGERAIDAGVMSGVRCKPSSAEAALEVAYCLAALTGGQREVGRNSFSS